ncbi:MAG: tetratricopeptide repeat protein, partial [Flavobacteriales bacterium]|nr:tetratricopeptide repeat protein [Flavobacteriales bacterium]
MKVKFCFISIIICLNSACVFSQINDANTDSKNTTLGNSSTTYFVSKNSTAISPHIAAHFISKGFSKQDAIELAEQFVIRYNSIHKTKSKLNNTDVINLGIEDDLQLISLLNWDLFLSHNNLYGAYIRAYSNTAKPWYGVSPEAFHEVFRILSSQHISADKIHGKLLVTTKIIDELSTSLKPIIESNKSIRKAYNYLIKGEFSISEKFLGKSILADKMSDAQENFNMARIKTINLKYNEANPYYIRAVQLYETNPRYVLAYANNLSINGDYKKAIINYKSSFRDLKTDDEEYNRKVSTRCNNLGVSYKATKDYDNALQYYQKAIELDLADLGETHPQIPVLYNNIAETYIALHNFKQAENYLRKALEIDLEIFGKQHPRIITRYNNLGTLYNLTGQTSLAVKLFEKALALNAKMFGELNPTIAD